MFYLELEFSHTKFKSVIKAKERKSHGGARAGAGRPASERRKVKISVSLDPAVLSKATQKWGGSVSPLVEFLLDRFSTNQQSNHAGQYE